VQAVFEDEDNVYVIIENCKGGELAAAVGQRHYSERTVSPQLVSMSCVNLPLPYEITTVCALAFGSQSLQHVNTERAKVP
jgi:hypothetical protein